MFFVNIHSPLTEISSTSTSPDVMVDKEEDFVLMNLVVIAFGNFIGKDNSFYDVTKKGQILEFLSTKIKGYDEDQIYT